MIGDKLIITDYHRMAAAMIFEKLKPLTDGGGVIAVSVAGESGCGKSETAFVLAELCEKENLKSVILGQDDYFVHPPKTNHRARAKDINWVGTKEVRLDLMDENITAIKKGDESVKKPLVFFEDDRIDEETLDVKGVRIVIAEGTYTTALATPALRGFINRNYRQTKKNRLKRSRDPATEFIEKVLEIEHRIISQHKEKADVVIPPPEGE